jgi:hypothetical protein
MCTVTLLRARGRTVLLCNRDELRSRELGTPPAFHQAGDRRALYPTDPRSGGTWVGVNDAGVIACLLNANPRAEARPPAVKNPRSRGEIVPALLRSGSLDEAVDLAGSLDASLYPPFRLLLADAQRALVTPNQAQGPGLVRAHGPIFLTSSSLGDDLVNPPRRLLFDILLAGAHDVHAAQLAFHRHHWPSHPHLSVVMRRPDARTVSRTCLTLDAEGVSLSTTPLSDHGDDLALPLISRLPFPRSAPRPALGASA